jgi:hypothetical protein
MQQMLMQKLHTMPASQTTATTAPSEPCSSASSKTCRYSIDPYLHRVYWALTNSEGQYLAAISGNLLHWAKSPNDIAQELRAVSHEVAMSRWLALKNVHHLSVEGLAIRPVDFYAHKSTPHIWCASDD